MSRNRLGVVDPNSVAGYLAKVKSAISSDVTHIGASDLGLIIRTAQDMGMKMPPDLMQDPMRPRQFPVECVENFIGLFEAFVSDQLGTPSASRKKTSTQPLAKQEAIGNTVVVEEDPLADLPLPDEDALMIPEPAKGKSGVEVPDPMTPSKGNPNLPRNQRGPSQVPPAPPSRLKIMSKSQLHVECRARHITVGDDATKPHMIDLISAHDEVTAASKTEQLNGGDE